MKKRRLLSIVTGLTMLFASTLEMTCFDVSAESYQGFEYEITDNEITITGAEPTEILNVPSEIDGIPVTALSEDFVFGLGFDGVKTLNIPASVTSIPVGENGISSSYLEDVNVDSANPVYSSDSGILFSKDMKTLLGCPAYKTGEYTIPEGVVQLEANAFEGADLTEIILPESLVTIGEECFSGSRLEKIFIPKNVSSFPETSFAAGCSAINYIAVDPDNNYYCDIDGILYDKAVTELILFPNQMSVDIYEIPDTVESIGWYAFWGGSVRIMKIPASVSSISYSATSISIWSNTLERVEVDDSNPIYYDVDGVLYSENQLLLYPPKKTDTEYTVPEGIEYINSGAIRGCDKLKNITVSEGVKNIDICGIYVCNNLKRLYLPSTLEHFTMPSFSDMPYVKQIYYGGTEEQFSEVTCGYWTYVPIIETDYLDSITINYSSDGFPKLEMGDIDESGVINASDASIILSEYASISSGESSSFTSDEFVSADVDGNAVVNSTDASIILGYYAYLSSTENAISFSDYMNK